MTALAEKDHLNRETVDIAEKLVEKEEVLKKVEQEARTVFQKL